MQALYQLDLRSVRPDDAGDLESVGGSVEQVCRQELVTEHGDEDEHDGAQLTQKEKLGSADREILQFATRLAEGTLQHRAEIDQRLQAVTRNWDLRRMAIVDRNVLRMAVYELMFCDDVPPKVAINEAIEIGKKFSTANSGGFVNGILDRIRIDLSKEGEAAEGV